MCPRTLPDETDKKYKSWQFLGLPCVFFSFFPIYSLSNRNLFDKIIPSYKEL